MASAAAGYSGTPLAAKRGLKDGMAAAFMALPPELDDLAEAVSFAKVAAINEIWSGLKLVIRKDRRYG